MCFSIRIIELSQCVSVVWSGYRNVVVQPIRVLFTYVSTRVQDLRTSMARQAHGHLGPHNLGDRVEAVLKGMTCTTN